MEVLDNRQSNDAGEGRLSDLLSIACNNPKATLINSFLSDAEKYCKRNNKTQLANDELQNNAEVQSSENDAETDKSHQETTPVELPAVQKTKQFNTCSPSASAMLRARYGHAKKYNQELEESWEDDIQVPAPVPFHEILKGLHMYAEVRDKEDNRSVSIKMILRRMGATVHDKLDKEVTHVIFREGHVGTYRRAKKMNCHILSMLWLDAVRTSGRRLPEQLYPILDLDIYESPVASKKIKKYKSMQPDYEGIREEFLNKKLMKKIEMSRKLQNSPSGSDGASSFSSNKKSRLSMGGNVQNKKSIQDRRKTMVHHISDYGKESSPLSDISEILAKVNRRENEISNYFKPRRRSSSDFETELSRKALNKCNEITEASNKRNWNVVVNRTPSPNRVVDLITASQDPRASISTPLTRKSPRRNISPRKSFVSPHRNTVAPIRNLASPRRNTVSPRRNIVVNGTPNKNSPLPALLENSQIMSPKLLKYPKKLTELQCSGTSDDTQISTNVECPVSPANSVDSTDLNRVLSALNNDRNGSLRERLLKGLGIKIPNSTNQNTDPIVDEADVSNTSSETIKPLKTTPKRKRNSTLTPQILEKHQQLYITEYLMSQNIENSPKRLKPNEPGTKKSKPNAFNFDTPTNEIFDTAHITARKKTVKNSCVDSPFVTLRKKKVAINEPEKPLIKDVSAEKNSDDENIQPCIDSDKVKTVTKKTSSKSSTLKNKSLAKDQSKEDLTATKDSGNLESDIMLSRVNLLSPQRSATPVRDVENNNSEHENCLVLTPSRRSTRIRNSTLILSPTSKSKLSSNLAVLDEQTDPKKNTKPTFQTKKSEAPNTTRSPFYSISTNSQASTSSTTTTNNTTENTTKFDQKKATCSNNFSRKTKLFTLSNLADVGSDVSLNDVYERPDCPYIENNNNKKKKQKSNKTNRSKPIKLASSSISRRSTHLFQENAQITRTQKNIKPKKISTIVCTRLHRDEISTFEQIVKNIGGFEIEHNVSSRTTHLVAGGPQRTLNMLNAIVRGCWILKYEWILRSLDAGKWLDEESFELIEFAPAVHKCRVERQTFGDPYKVSLFNDCGAIFIAKDTKPPQSELQSLVKLAGGTVVTSPRQANVIVGQEYKSNNRRNSVADIFCVNEKWILESITMKYVKNYRKFLLNKNTQAE